MDAITLLKNDHHAVEQLFRRFEKAGDRALVEKRQIVDRIIEELSVHASIEEQLFYPVARATVPNTEDVALESLEEHHIVKWLLSELDGLDPSSERFVAKVTVLMESVRHHVEEEESEFFPKVRHSLGRTALSDLGEAMAQARKSAPTHPHPRAADVPPANSVAGTIASVLDRVGDNITGIAQGGVSAAQDFIARVLNSKKPKVSPTGASLARTRANNVRTAAASATDGVAMTARSVKSGVKKAARAATSGAKGTATTAKKSVRATATTAKRAATTTGRTAQTASRTTARTAKRAAPRTTASAKSARSSV